jgi:two-component system phosphate regulon response regulator PhoB
MNHGGKILIAEDEADVQDLVSLHLRNAGYMPVNALDGPEAIRRAREDSPSLIVLDIMLSGMNGLEVCKLLKADAATCGIPLIMLTAKAEEPDRIIGLELGADDYMTKPFSPRELVLRIKSVLRRAGPAAAIQESAQLKAGMVAIDRERHLVRVRGKQIELTATEFKLLSLLIERRGRVQSRDGLLNEVWGYESAIDTRTVDTHVRRLREKLGPGADCIETIRGFGYRVAEV